MQKILTVIFFLFCMKLAAQSLSPQVISSSGNNYSNASAKIEFTIGEPLTTSLTAGGNTLTQGFHQPELHFASLENYANDYTFSLYPNPAEQFVTVEATKPEDMQVHIFNSLGETIRVSSVFQQKITIDLQALASGSYILMITAKSGQPLHSYTLIKKSAY